MQCQLKYLETQVTSNNNDSKNDFSLLFGRLKTVEDAISHLSSKNEILLLSERLKTVEDTIPHLSTKNEIMLLSGRIKTAEDSIPHLNTQIKELEDINRNCDFPNSLTTLVGQKLNEHLAGCLQKLNDIESMENEF
jgi:predicted  nucleic acid-binding Zn-ribbon protein